MNEWSPGTVPDNLYMICDSVLISQSMLGLSEVRWAQYCPMRLLQNKNIGLPWCKLKENISPKNSVSL